MTLHIYNDDEDDDDDGDGNDDEGYESFGVSGGKDSSQQAAVVSLELLKSQSPFEIHLTFISLLRFRFTKNFPGSNISQLYVFCTLFLVCVLLSE